MNISNQLNFGKSFAKHTAFRMYLENFYQLFNNTMRNK